MTGITEVHWDDWNNTGDWDDLDAGMTCMIRMDRMTINEMTKMTRMTGMIWMTGMTINEMTRMTGMTEMIWMTGTTCMIG